MMVPSFLLLGIGRQPRLWIPLPVLLLVWPIWLLGWAVWLVMWFFRIPGERVVQIALIATFHLSGLRVDVDTTGGDNIHIRLI